MHRARSFPSRRSLPFSYLYYEARCTNPATNRAVSAPERGLRDFQTPAWPPEYLSAGYLTPCSLAGRQVNPCCGCGILKRTIVRTIAFSWHPKTLSKAEQRTLRRLHTVTLLRPAVIKRFSCKTDGSAGSVERPEAPLTWCGDVLKIPAFPFPYPYLRDVGNCPPRLLFPIEYQRALVERAQEGASSCGVPDKGCRPCSGATL